jgi:cyclin-dependent kinase 7
LVAIKRILSVTLTAKTEKERVREARAAMKNGVNMSALREVKILRELSIPGSTSPGAANIMRLLDVFLQPPNSDICAVYEYCPSDLQKVLATTNSLPIKTGDVKSFARTLLAGLDFCHRRGVVHRDLKPDNLLFTASKVMKLGDFGLSRVLPGPGQPMSVEPITLWYKPPEMLLGECYYTQKADMWSVGCVFAECMLRRPFLPGGPGDHSQLEKIFGAFGTPGEGNWPDHGLLPLCVRGLKWSGGEGGKHLKDLFKAAKSDAVDLLEKIMRLNPKERLTAREALKHPYFENAPVETERSKLPIPL